MRVDELAEEHTRATQALGVGEGFDDESEPPAAAAAGAAVAGSGGQSALLAAIAGRKGKAAAGKRALSAADAAGGAALAQQYARALGAFFEEGAAQRVRDLGDACDGEAGADAALRRVAV